jgi:pimeloyl-ACP methyl ester carboxylesterase
MKFYLCVALSLLCLPSLYAQQLQRKAGLGVGFYQRVPDSLATRLHYKKGAIIQFVVPNSTAAALGVQKDDIITAINAVPVEAPNQILSALKPLRAGDSIHLALIRQQAPKVLHGIARARSMESSASAEVVYGEFACKNGYVRTIYKTLKGKKPLGTVYFLQGLPCYSMDNFQELDKTKQAIDAMVERGFAVFRMEKGDMGDNLGFPPCEQMGYFEELAMYEAGYRHLLSLPAVDTSRIFLFGHSMGGITAPLLAEKFQPRGAIVYGTVFKPWLEYLCDAYLIQLQLRGEDAGELRASLEQHKPYLYDYFYKNIPLEAVILDPAGMRAAQEILGYDPRTGLGSSGRSPLVFKELNQCNLAKSWSAFENYSLAIYGECDIAANNPDDHQALIRLVNQKRPGHGTFWLAPGTTHTFEEIGTMEQFMEWQNNPQAFAQYAATHFNPKVFDYVCDWMQQTLDKPLHRAQPASFRDGSEALPDEGARKASMDVRAADLDGDGDTDLVLANEFQPNSILINDGKGHFSDESAQRLPQPAHDSEDVAIADFNGDGLPDLIFCSEDDRVHEYYLNTGKGVFREAPWHFPDSEANAVLSADLNGDKKPDVVFGNKGQNQVFINDGKGGFAPDPKRLPDIQRVTQDLALLDVDGDGDLDYLEGNEDGNVLCLNNGKGFFKDVSASHLPALADMETRKIAFADVDNDGDTDLFFANVAFQPGKNPQNRLYLNNGKGVFSDVTGAQLPADTDHTIDAVFEDLNLDGSPDLLLANVFGAPLKAYLNNGKGVFEDQSDRVFGKKYLRDALGIIAVDLNADGRRDLYVCDRYNPALDRKDLLLWRE